MIALPKVWSRERTSFALLVAIGVIGGGLAFPLNYFANSNVLIGLCLFPFSLFIDGTKRSNWQYAVISISLAVLASLYGIRIFYFFALSFYFLWLVEFFIGRLNAIILFLIFLMSPFFIQVATILGFPLRLLLSQYAGSLLNLVGVKVQLEGNMMIMGNEMFSVDEACMGLNMLVISMLMGVSALVFRYRLSGKLLGLYPAGFFFMIAFGLNAVTNLLRIILLVYFRIPPEDPMHEFVGVLCLVFYVVVPLYFISGWFVHKYGQSRDIPVARQPLKPIHPLIFILPIVIITVGTLLEHSRKASTAPHPNVRFANGTTEKLQDGIVKISTDQLLIYVKSIPEFFSGEHTPLICWKGGGYKFSGVATTTVAGIEIYRGILVKDGEALHTAWWYNNGMTTTISQVDWRVRMLKGEDRFCLVNVTAKSEKTLFDAVHLIFKEHSMTISH